MLRLVYFYIVYFGNFGYKIITLSTQKRGQWAVCMFSILLRNHYVDFALIFIETRGNRGSGESSGTSTQCLLYSS